MRQLQAETGKRHGGDPASRPHRWVDPGLGPGSPQADTSPRRTRPDVVSPAMDRLLAVVSRFSDEKRRAAALLLWRSSPRSALAFAAVICAAAVAPVAVLLALGNLIEHVMAGASSGELGFEVRRSFAIVAVALVLTMVTGPLQRYIATVTRTRLMFGMQERLLDVVNAAPRLEHVESPQTTQRLELARGTLTNWYPADAPAALAKVWTNRLTGLVAAIAVGWSIWWVGVLLIVVWPLTRRPIIRVINEHVGAFGGNADVMVRARYFHQLATRPAAAKEVRIFGLGPWLVDMFRSHWTRAMEHVWQVRSGVHAVIAKVSLVLLATYAIAYGATGWAAYHGDLDLAALVVVLPALAITMTHGGVGFDDISLEWMLGALPHRDTVERELASPSGAVASPSTMPAPVPVTTGIRLSSLAFAYDGADDRVLNDLDLYVPAGRTTAIVGLNGAGKTTLIKLLSGLYTPTEGSIEVDGQPLTSIHPAAWRRSLAVVFQDFARYPFSAAENVGLGRMDRVDDTRGIESALARAGILDAVRDLPAGLDTRLAAQYADGTELSGGQWQRVALGRALFAVESGASVLVLDEPTAWMDARGEATFFDQLLDITAGITTILVSHRFGTVRLADKICVLADGAIIEEGTHDELVAVDGEYRSLFDAQAERFAREAS